MDRAFAALGDPTRRRILEVLARGELPVGAIVEELAATGRISQPAVSQHLAALRAAGLVTARAEGRSRVHALDPTGVTLARSWLAALVDPGVAEPAGGAGAVSAGPVAAADPLAVFAQPLDALATEVARGRRDRRGTDREATERRRAGSEAGERRASGREATRRRA